MEQVNKIQRIEFDGSFRLSNMSNLVLIEFDENEKIGGLIYSQLSKDLNEYGSAPCTGTVFKAPGRLFTALRNPYSMSWVTNMELKEGDKVWFQRTIFLNAPQLIHKGKKLVFIPYEEIYIAKRGDFEFMLNGYLLVKPKVVEDKFLAYSNKEISLSRGVILKTCPAVEYISGDYDEIDVKEGDEIICSDEYRVELEDEMFSTYSKDKCFVVQRREIAYVQS